MYYFVEKYVSFVFMHHKEKGGPMKRVASANGIRLWRIWRSTLELREGERERAVSVLACEAAVLVLRGYFAGIVIHLAHCRAG